MRYIKIRNSTTGCGIQGKPDPAKNRRTSPLLGCTVYVAFNALLLFGSAGTLDWPMAWAFIAVSLAVFVAQVMRSNPDLQEDRSRRHKDSKRWDRVLVSIITVLSLSTLVVAGLTVRFGQGGQVPLPIPIVALIILTLGNCLISWATWTNRFFSATVRIQNDRGHAVVSDGPYRFVRHPGYTGMIVVNLVMPLALGSYWALVPAAIVAALFIVRTYLEDTTLRKELGGYRDYAGQVKYRLMPGVW